MPSTATPAPVSPSSSWRLLARARAGDDDARERLFERYLPQLYRWAHGRARRWIRAAADTSDLVQDALVRTLARFDAFEPRGRQALGAYLRAAVRNRIQDHRRHAARWQTSDLAPEQLPSTRSSPFDAATLAQIATRYQAALERLPPRDRELVVAHFELDYSHAQLGCMIGRTPHAARMALCRAIERLAELMDVR